MTQRATNTNSSQSTGATRPGGSMDPEIPIRYLRENFQPGDRIAVVLIQKQTHKVIQRIASVDKIAGGEFQAWLPHANASHFEVYVGMNALKPEAHSRTKEDVAAIPPRSAAPRTSGTRPYEPEAVPLKMLGLT